MKRLIKKSQLLEMYHGTSSDKVDSIMSSGIRVVDGGYGDGAYVTKDLNEARKYALKRAGDRRKHSNDYPQFADIYPVIIVIKIDDSRLTHGFKDIYYDKEGINLEDIVEARDISNDPIWQNLLTYVKYEKSENESEKDQSNAAYSNYYSEVASIV